MFHGAGCYEKEKSRFTFLTMFKAYQRKLNRTLTRCKQSVNRTIYFPSIVISDLDIRKGGAITAVFIRQ